jgi:hypothetical protein
MGPILGIVGLIVMAIIWYVDWSQPDKKAESLTPNDLHTVTANNKRKADQIADLEKRVDILNAKYPDKEFYRDGPYVKERSGSKIPSTKGFKKYRGDSYLAKHEVPHLLSRLLRGCGKEELFWDDDKRRIIFRPDCVAKPHENYVEWTQMLLADFEQPYDDRERFLEWIDQLRITQLEPDEVTMRPQVAIEPKPSLLEDHEYLSMEVANHGRRFIRNVGNSHRWLIGASITSENMINRGLEGWKISVSTSFLKPATMNPFEDYSPAKMQRKEIIENLESRLWNRKRVQSFNEIDGIAHMNVS